MNVLSFDSYKNHIIFWLNWHDALWLSVFFWDLLWVKLWARQGTKTTNILMDGTGDITRTCAEGVSDQQSSQWNFSRLQVLYLCTRVDNGTFWTEKERNVYTQIVYDLFRVRSFQKRIEFSIFLFKKKPSYPHKIKMASKQDQTFTRFDGILQ